jgi:hypothetical protein
VDNLAEKTSEALLIYLAHTLVTIERTSEALGELEDRHQEAFADLGKITGELKKRFGEYSTVTHQGKQVTLKQIDDGDIWEIDANKEGGR